MTKMGNPCVFGHLGGLGVSIWTDSPLSPRCLGMHRPQLSIHWQALLLEEEEKGHFIADARGLGVSWKEGEVTPVLLGDCHVGVAAGEMRAGSLLV